jgi:hypothetical protein
LVIVLWLPIREAALGAKQTGEDETDKHTDGKNGPKLDKMHGHGSALVTVVKLHRRIFWRL